MKQITQPLPIHDALSPNRNLYPVTTSIDDTGKMLVGGCILSELAKQYGTPLYVIDEETIRNSCKAYKNALSKYYPAKSLPLYASKANSSLAISKIISSEGFGLDAVSEGELLTALKGGVDPLNIVLHGNNKSLNELELAINNKVKIVVDNFYDIERLNHLASRLDSKIELMLRFTPGIECHTHEYIRTGHLDSKFGFDPDQLDLVLEKLAQYDWALLTGLHAHIGSQIFELDPHRDLAGVMAETLKIARDLGHPVTDLNVGGGLGIRYVESDDPPSIETWVKIVSSSVEQACLERGLDLPRLLCEPGRSLVATSGLTLYTIGATKDIPGIRKYISVDGGMSDNPRPITYQSLYSACLVDRPLDKAVELITIAGKHCESGDILLKDVSLPSPKYGDVLGIFSTGAYNLSMSSNYNRIPRPASVIVANGQADLIQRRETPEDLLQYDVIPERLLG